ncbi:MAG: GspH/FimT family pseudopilin [bacterium]
MRPAFIARGTVESRVRPTGFTLVEMGIVLATISIMSAIAFPNISSMMANYRLKAAARDVMSHLQRAKMVAVKNNSLCTLTFNQHVEGVPYDYVVYEDDDRDYEYDAGERILASVKFSDYKSGVGLDHSKGGGDGVTFAENDAGRPSIAFNSRGLPVSPGGVAGMGMGSVYLVNNRETKKWISVHKAGRIRIQ